LLSVVKATGVASGIGGFGGERVMTGLAFDHSTGTLYGSSYWGKLYTIDQSSGAATLLGDVTGTNGTVARIAFDQADGTLYGITNSEQLVTIDIPSLVGTEVAQFSVPNQIYALDFVGRPVIPAPGAFVLSGIGASLAGWLRRRRAL
jgi:hypothetical protein